VIEILLDPRPLVKVFLDVAGKVEEDNRESAEQSVKVVKALGLDTLGPIAYRTALDGNTMNTGMFASLPTPRTGIFTLVDQTQLAAEPPEWVAADVISYEQLSFDVAKAYRRIKSLVSDTVGPQAGAAFNLVEGQLTQTLQVSVDELLSSLGQKHIVLGFVPRTDAGADDDAGATSGRSGLVWQVKDEATWRKVLQVGATMSGQEPVEEQGFMGIRVSQPQFEGGVFLGRGFLVIGAGDSVIESLLSMLRRPPEGDASLRGSQIYRRASEMIAPEACLIYQLIDNNRNIKAARAMVVNALEVIKTHQPDDADDDDNLKNPLKMLNPAMVDKLLGLLPSEDELEGAIGVGVTQTKVNDTGVVSRSVVELPPKR
jgi:hypothetical protein